MKQEFSIGKESIKQILLISLGIIAVILMLLNLYEKSIYVKEIQSDEDQCWLWVLDLDGNGFGTTTNYCVQLEYNCENDLHYTDCEWIEETNFEGSIEGCKCISY